MALDFDKVAIQAIKLQFVVVEGCNRLFPCFRRDGLLFVVRIAAIIIAIIHPGHGDGFFDAAKLCLIIFEFDLDQIDAGIVDSDQLAILGIPGLPGIPRIANLLTDQIVIGNGVVPSVFAFGKDRLVLNAREGIGTGAQWIQRDPNFRTRRDQAVLVRPDDGLVGNFFRRSSGGIVDAAVRVGVQQLKCKRFFGSIGSVELLADRKLYIRLQFVVKNIVGGVGHGRVVYILRTGRQFVRKFAIAIVCKDVAHIGLQLVRRILAGQDEVPFLRVALVPCRGFGLLVIIQGIKLQRSAGPFTKDGNAVSVGCDGLDLGNRFDNRIFVDPVLILLRTGQIIDLNLVEGELCPRQRGIDTCGILLGEGYRAGCAGGRGRPLGIIDFSLFRIGDCVAASEGGRIRQFDILIRLLVVHHLGIHDPNIGFVRKGANQYIMPVLGFDAPAGVTDQGVCIAAVEGDAGGHRCIVR